MNSNAYRSPIVRKMVLDIVKRLKEGEAHIDITYTLDADLVPKVSEKMFIPHKMKQSLFIPKPVEPIPAPVKMERSLVVNTEIKPRVAPKIVYPTGPQIKNPVPNQQQNIPQTIYELPQMAPPKIEPTPSLSNVQLNHLYHGKMAGLLNDPSVMSIECVGQNTPLNIYRGGQKQRTKIVLTKIDIDNLLREISQQSKIPLGEGVFRVIVNNLMINAVISDLVGTRFVIKKLFSMNH